MKAAATKAGANVLHGLRWVVEDIAPAELRRRAAQNPTAPPADVELDLYTTLNELPLGSNPLIRDAAPFYLERLAHPTPGEYWLDKGEPGIAGLGPISSRRVEAPETFVLRLPWYGLRHRFLPRRQDES